MAEQTRNIMDSGWKVFFSGRFGENSGRERPGTEYSIQKEFKWNGSNWRILSAYCCGKGLVLDLCEEIPLESVSTDSKPHHDQSNGQQLFFQSEDLRIESIHPQVNLNGRELDWNQSCTITWNPHDPQEADCGGEKAIKHYQLNPQLKWRLERMTFLWATKRTPIMRSVELQLAAERIPVFGASFPDLWEGQLLELENPVTGEQYRLSVREISQETLPPHFFADGQWTFPRCMTQLSYTVTPELSDGNFCLVDTEPGDNPVPKDGQKMADGGDAAAFGIIGSADGPVAVAVSCVAGSRETIHHACSALRFQHAEQVKWRAMFWHKICEDVTV